MVLETVIKPEWTQSAVEISVRNGAMYFFSFVTLIVV